MIASVFRTVLLVVLAALSACSPKKTDEAKPKPEATATETALLKVGTVTVDQADLDYQLKEKPDRGAPEEVHKRALAELANRAQLAQAAIDEGLLQDPMVRAEFARILANRLKEKNLTPRLKAVAETPIPESRLRELYAADESRYRSNEKRHLAVLWLNPNRDPQREKQYVEKLSIARDWFFNNADLKDHPDQGFSTLGADYSEHQASRYTSGIVGWLESAGGMDDWTKALAQIGFSLKEPGEVSAVISRPEGVFLVRYMAMKPAMLRPFESVADELSRAEQQRLRKAAESEFKTMIEAKHPVSWLKS